jgi:hypothetical protein
MTLHKHLQPCKFETQIIYKTISSGLQEPHWISGFKVFWDVTVSNGKRWTDVSKDPSAFVFKDSKSKKSVLTLPGAEDNGTDMLRNVAVYQ